MEYNNEDDDTMQLSGSESNNAPSPVYLDSGTMKFVKYVDRGALSSCCDVALMLRKLRKKHSDQSSFQYLWRLRYATT